MAKKCSPCPEKPFFTHKIRTFRGSEKILSHSKNFHGLFRGTLLKNFFEHRPDADPLSRVPDESICLKISYYSNI